MRSGGYFDRSRVSGVISNYEKEMNQPDFWNDSARAQKVSKEINSLKQTLERDDKLGLIKDDLQTYLILLAEEFSENLLSEAAEELKPSREFINQAEITALLSGKHDSNNAILTIHPGAGGTESQDWAEMLLRMYTRWAESNGFTTEMIDYLAGEEAGIKSVTLEIMGDHAFGYLKAESGVHRLVRISPFNAQGKRQTSFASVFVYPMIDNELDIEIETKDLRIDTYRASGKGGQGVNTTDSAVRITHLPTNIVVQCQNERSQIMNREVAMKILKSRLFQLREEEKEKEKKQLENTKTEIGWGNQIRSYVFHPYQMVKDHRTSHETGQINNVMDGDISDFMNAYLKQKASKE